MKLRGFSVVLVALLSGYAVAGGAPPSSPELIAKGSATFKTSCASCHGNLGDGKSPVAATLNPKPRNFVAEAFKFGNQPEQVFKTISEGSKGTAMPPFKFLSEGDRWGLAYYVLSLQKK
jgi:high-affinity iron transporter